MNLPDVSYPREAAEKRLGAPAGLDLDALAASLSRQHTGEPVSVRDETGHSAVWLRGECQPQAPALLGLSVGQALQEISRLQVKPDVPNRAAAEAVEALRNHWVGRVRVWVRTVVEQPMTGADCKEVFARDLADTAKCLDMLTADVNKILAKVHDCYRLNDTDRRLCE